MEFVLLRGPGAGAGDAPQDARALLREPRLAVSNPFRRAACHGDQPRGGRLPTGIHCTGSSRLLIKTLRRKKPSQIEALTEPARAPYKMRMTMNLLQKGWYFTSPK